jgi:phage baseplate assembly protein W
MNGQAGPPADDKAFLGVGWAFPVELADSGDVTLSAHEQDIHQAVEIILGTVPGERVMRPDFGSGLHAMVFEPITTTTKELARHRVEQALTLWEPRIDSIDVQVSDEREEGVLQLSITYRVRSTNTFYNLVYPFYLMEGTGT